jgi:general secretion pathway protein L
MPILVILLAPRERLRAGGTPGPERRAGELAYVTSDDGLNVLAQGRCAAPLLPKADTVIAVIADGDVGWHRIVLPKAPPARLRAALTGVLEEALLDEADGLHFALAPGATPGQETWVAAVHKAWLAGQLAALEKAGIGVDRVVPISWPDEPALGHFWQPPDADAADPLMLTWTDARGVTTLRLDGGMARELLAQWQSQSARWSATPAAAAPAERWLGAAVRVLGDEERALQATRSLWNLRQFDLTPHHRGTLALRDAWKKVRSPAWRPVRIGLAALVLLQGIGLNLWAWHQRGEIADRKQAMVDLLRTTHPQVRAVLDAPVQMQRETAVLRAAAGRAGGSDLEALMQAASHAWPDDRGPADALRFESGSLTFTAAGWSDAQIEGFRQRLHAEGFTLDSADGRLTMSRSGGTPGGRS